MSELDLGKLLEGIKYEKNLKVEYDPDSFQRAKMVLMKYTLPKVEYNGMSADEMLKLILKEFYE